MKVVKKKASSKSLDFRTKVLGVVREIERGETISYKQVAVLAGNPKAARAVGTILKTNYNREIPCHRVIRSDGELGGYNRGAKRKSFLLKKEGYGQIKIKKTR